MSDLKLWITNIVAHVPDGTNRTKPVVKPVIVYGDKEQAREKADQLRLKLCQIGETGEITDPLIETAFWAGVNYAHPQLEAPAHDTAFEELLYEKALWAVEYVGSANYPSREKQAKRVLRFTYQNRSAPGVHMLDEWEIRE